MLIDPQLSEKTFSPARNKESVDGGEVREHLRKLNTAIITANSKHHELSKSAGKQSEQIQVLTKRVKELEERPEPTQLQVKTIKLAEKLHQEIVDEANRKAAGLLEASTAQAEQIIRDAKEEGARAVEHLADQVNEMTRRIEKLSQFEREHYARMTAFLEGQIQSLGTREPEKLVPPIE